MSEKLLKIAEACEILSITPTYLYRLVRERQISAIRIGTRGIRFEEDAVKRFCDSRRITITKEPAASNPGAAEAKNA